jgi:hypothetical protein
VETGRDGEIPGPLETKGIRKMEEITVEWKLKESTRD